MNLTKDKLKIVFFGTPEFAVESLSALVENGFNIVGVVTMPDKPAGRGHKLLHSPIKQYAVAHNLRLMQPTNLKSPDFIEDLQKLEADLFIVIAFRMLPEVVWAMPPLGTFNLHASLLPKYRGAAPINRAVMNGDTVTGVTTFMLKQEIDTGDILQQVDIDILPDENVGDVHDKLMVLGAKLTVDTVNHIIAGDLSPIPQDELIKDVEPTPAPKIFAEDMTIDWKNSAEKIHNQIRGLSPYPAARAFFKTGHDAAPELMKIYKSKIVETKRPTPQHLPGDVEICGGRMFVTVGDGHLIEIIELQPSGKKRMSADAFLRGARLENPVFVAF